MEKYKFIHGQNILKNRVTIECKRYCLLLLAIKKKKIVFITKLDRYAPST